MRMIWAIPVIAAGMAAPAAAQDALTQTIAAREAGWAAAFNAGEFDAVAAFYEEDAVMMAPGAPRIEGRAAIRRAMDGFATTISDVKLDTASVRALGSDYALELGDVRYRQKQADGGTAPVHMKYQIIWHRGADGVWRYLSDMFNALPAEDATAA